MLNKGWAEEVEGGGGEKGEGAEEANRNQKQTWASADAVDSPTVG